MIDVLRQLYGLWRDILLNKPKSRMELFDKLFGGVVLLVLTPLLLAAFALSAIVTAGLIWAAVPYIAGGALLAFELLALVLGQIPLWASIIIILLMLILVRLNALTRD